MRISNDKRRNYLMNSKLFNKLQCNALCSMMISHLNYLRIYYFNKICCLKKCQINNIASLSI